jgi:hypothetical protein
VNKKVVMYGGGLLLIVVFVYYRHVQKLKSQSEDTNTSGYSHNSGTNYTYTGATGQYGDVATPNMHYADYLNWLQSGSNLSFQQYEQQLFMSNGAGQSLPVNGTAVATTTKKKTTKKKKGKSSGGEKEDGGSDSGGGSSSRGESENDSGAG